ncbi:hypothetical protein [Nigerium massiliense]|uniref:hypothetical protein n=1 Tax=Nigerium massiliense TaxID=1522317 RepID=UPI000694D15B|nr:hypothetical protein [Nigerium massiliense]
MRRLLAGAVWALLVALLAPAPAQAAPSASAPATCAGVWVFVGTDQRCAPAYGTGTEVLTSAGFDVTRSGGMICQIDARPANCVIRNDAYWSYWYAERRADGSYGPWTYATTGDTQFQPAYGDAQGWSFGDGKNPPPVRPAAGSISPATPPPAPASPATAAASPAPAAPAATGDGGLTGLLTTLGILVVGGALVAVALVRRRRAS